MNNPVVDQDQEEPGLQLLDLPDHLLTVVLGQLGDVISLCAAARTCRQLWELAGGPGTHVWTMHVRMHACTLHNRVDHMYTRAQRWPKLRRNHTMVMVHAGASQLWPRAKGGGPLERAVRCCIARTLRLPRQVLAVQLEPKRSRKFPVTVSDHAH